MSGQDIVREFSDRGSSGAPSSQGLGHHGGSDSVSVPVLPSLASGPGEGIAAWDAIHKTRAWGAYPSEHVIRFVNHHYGDGNRDRLHFLDIGCGYGASAWFLAREGFKVRALDCSAYALRRLRERAAAEQLGSKIAYQHTDVRRAVWSPGLFDAAIDICTLQHLAAEDAAESLALVRRALSSRGRIFSVMAADGYSDGASGSIEPRKIDLFGVNALFCEFRDIEIGRETVDRADGLKTVHWIIEARK